MDFDYDEYVKKYVMILCGMMYIKIGRLYVFVKICDINEFFMSDVVKVGFEFVGFVLGWEFNMYDIMRFFCCLDGFGDFKILFDKFLNFLIVKFLVVLV